MKVKKLKKELQKYKDDEEVVIWVSYKLRRHPEFVGSVNEITSIKRNGGCQLGVELYYEFEDHLQCKLCDYIDLEKKENTCVHNGKVMTVELLRKFISEFDDKAQVFLVMIDEDEVYPVDPYIGRDEKKNCMLCIGNSCPCCNPPH